MCAGGYRWCLLLADLCELASCILGFLKNQNKARAAKLPHLESVGENADECGGEDDDGDVHDF